MGKNSKIGELLIDSGLIDGFQLNLALAYSRHWDCRTGEALISLGFLTEQNLRTFLVKQFGLPQVNLISSKISKDVLNYIPESKAREYCVIPVDRISKKGITHLIVAMPDPTNLHVIDILQFITDCWIIPTMASADLILHKIDFNYGVDSQSKKINYPNSEFGNFLSQDKSKNSEWDSLSLNSRVRIIEKYFINLVRNIIEDNPSSQKKLSELLIKFIEEQYN
ncbi:MAG: hypothetical protein P8Y96_12335 [Desulfuromonadales bacterium]|jgi:hypothetical protein